jgi:molybdate transport system ATP-binding protein
MTDALYAELVVTRGDFTLDVAFTLSAGETVALLGPNGAGKSTLLAALSGLIAPTAGTVTVAGRPLTQRVASARFIAVPPEHRRVGLLRQEALLFPHLSAVENVAFGQRVQGMRRSDALRDAAEWLAAVDLEDYAHRKPAALSGGQQQRVAIARALAARPDVLLLDEPLAALDVQTASQVRRLLAERLKAEETTTILVTHDVLDAIVLADRCAILQDGRIIDDGPKSRVLAHPKNQFIAALAGVTLFVGVFDGIDGVRRSDGRMLRGRLASGAHAAVGDAVSAVFPPGAITVRTAQRTTQRSAADNAGGAEGLNTDGTHWSVTVNLLEPAAGGIRIRVVEEPELIVELTPAAAIGLDLHPGARLRVSIDPAAVTIRPA